MAEDRTVKTIEELERELNQVRDERDAARLLLERERQTISAMNDASESVARMEYHREEHRSGVEPRPHELAAAKAVDEWLAVEVGAKKHWWPSWEEMMALEREHSGSPVVDALRRITGLSLAPLSQVLDTVRFLTHVGGPWRARALRLLREAREALGATTDDDVPEMARSLLKRSSPGLRTWRFSEPNRNGEGWWVAFIDEAGCFSVLSDFGDFAHRWPSSPESLGEPNLVRFLARAGADYVLGKIARHDWFDAEASEKKVRAHLIERGDEEIAATVTIRNEVALWTAIYDFSIDDEDESIRRYELDFPPQARAFMANIWPRIVVQLKAAIARGDA